MINLIINLIPAIVITLVVYKLIPWSDRLGERLAAWVDRKMRP